jgi:hypothetical protein
MTAILDLRKTPEASVSGCLTWIDRIGLQHWRPGTPEWVAAFGAERRFKPGDLVRVVRYRGDLQLRRGMEFIAKEYHTLGDIPGRELSSGRMLWCQSRSNEFDTRLIMESDLEAVP